jgi:hypothetical protein
MNDWSYGCFASILAGALASTAMLDHGFGDRRKLELPRFGLVEFKGLWPWSFAHAKASELYCMGRGDFRVDRGSRCFQSQ